MATERVDKQWVTRGIDCYSVEAILGTLGHYGVAIDAEGYKALAKEDFPLGIAEGWHRTWKGTGQFAHFPAAASEELWRRLIPEDIAPTDVALAVIKLVDSLDASLVGKDADVLETRFKVVEAYLPRVPPPSDRRELFIAEMTVAIGEFMEAVDGIAEALAAKSKRAEADRFVLIEEALWPVRTGVSRALVQAAAGEKASALASLNAIATDVKQDVYARLGATDGLLKLEAVDDAVKALLPLIDIAEQTKDVELASEVVEFLNEIIKADPSRADKAQIRARVERLSDALGDGEDDE